MDQADDIFMQVLTEMRRQLAIVRTLVRALPRLLRRRSRLEDRRDAAQQDPVVDRNQNPDQSAQWGANERELRQLEASNARLAAENAGRLQALESRQAELQALTAEVNTRIAQDPELAAQVGQLSQADQDLVSSAVAGNFQAELHGDEMVRRPDGSLMTRNEELQSLTADVRTQVAGNPELSAQVAQLSQAEQDLVYRQTALGVQQELDRRFPDSRDPNYLSAEQSERTPEALDRQAESNQDQDHDLVPDDVEDDREAQDRARLRDEQDKEYQQYVDPNGNGIPEVEDREAERALRDQEAAQQKDQQRRQDLEEQERTESGAEAAATAAGTAAVVDDRAEDLDEPETDQARQPELNEPDAEQVRQREGLDGADPGQVQGAQGPEVGQGADRDGAAQSVVGGDQQPGQDQQATGADQSGQRVVNIGSMNGGAFAVGQHATATVNNYGPGQDQSGVDPSGVDQPDGPGQQARRADALEKQLAEDREENGQGTVRVGSVSNSSMNGVKVGDQGLQGGEFTSREDGGVDYRGTTPDGQDVEMQFGPGSTVGGKPMDAAELNRIQAQQAGIPPAGSPQQEGRSPAVATGHAGNHPGKQAAVNKGGAGKGNEGGGREPEGR